MGVHFNSHLLAVLLVTGALFCLAEGKLGPSKVSLDGVTRLQPLGAVTGRQAAYQLPKELKIIAKLVESPADFKAPVVGLQHPRTLYRAVRDMLEAGRASRSGRVLSQAGTFEERVCEYDREEKSCGVAPHHLYSLVAASNDSASRSFINLLTCEQWATMDQCKLDNGCIWSGGECKYAAFEGPGTLLCKGQEGVRGIINKVETCGSHTSEAACKQSEPCVWEEDEDDGTYSCEPDLSIEEEKLLMQAVHPVESVSYGGLHWAMAYAAIRSHALINEYASRMYSCDCEALSAAQKELKAQGELKDAGLDALMRLNQSLAAVSPGGLEMDLACGTLCPMHKGVQSAAGRMLKFSEACLCQHDPVACKLRKLADRMTDTLKVCLYASDSCPAGCKPVANSSMQAGESHDGPMCEVDGASVSQMMLEMLRETNPTLATIMAGHLVCGGHSSEDSCTDASCAWKQRPSNASDDDSEGECGLKKVEESKLMRAAVTEAVERYSGVKALEESCDFRARVDSAYNETGCHTLSSADECSSNEGCVWYDGEDDGEDEGEDEGEDDGDMSPYCQKLLHEVEHPAGEDPEGYARLMVVMYLMPSLVEYVKAGGNASDFLASLSSAAQPGSGQSSILPGDMTPRPQASGAPDEARPTDRPGLGSQQPEVPGSQPPQRRRLTQQRPSEEPNLGSQTTQPARPLPVSSMLPVEGSSQPGEPRPDFSKPPLEGSGEPLPFPSMMPIGGVGEGWEGLNGTMDPRIYQSVTAGGHRPSGGPSYVSGEQGPRGGDGDDGEDGADDAAMFLSQMLLMASGYVPGYNLFDLSKPGDHNGGNTSTSRAGHCRPRDSDSLVASVLPAELQQRFNASQQQCSGRVGAATCRGVVARRNVLARRRLQTTFPNVDFASFTANASAVTTFTLRMQARYAALLGVPDERVNITLSPGSLVVEAEAVYLEGEEELQSTAESAISSGAVQSAITAEAEALGDELDADLSSSSTQGSADTSPPTPTSTPAPTSAPGDSNSTGSPSTESPNAAGTSASTHFLLTLAAAALAGVSLLLA